MSNKMSKIELKEILIREVGKLPSNFKTFLNKSANTKYMFYHKYGSNDYKGYCCCGHNDITLIKPKSGKIIECPCCHNEVRLKNDIYGQRENDIAIRAYLEKCSFGYIERLFYVINKTEYNSNSSPRVITSVSFREEQRSILTHDEAYLTIHPRLDFDYGYDYINKEMRLKWLYGRQRKYGMGWNSWCAEESIIIAYPNNLGNAFNDSKYKYAEIETFVENIKLDPLKYLKIYPQIPQIEYLLKLKLYNIAFQYYKIKAEYWRESRYLNMNGKTVEEICGLKSKKDIELASKYDLTAIEVKAYLMMKREWHDEISYNAIKFRTAIIDRSGEDFTYDFISFEKLYNYYLNNNQKYQIRDFLNDYQDYISAALQLKMNLFDTKVKTPHDFKYCHDLCLARKDELIKKEREKAKRKRDRDFKKISNNYNEIFKYSDKKYSIIVPLSVTDLKREGEQNNNCVSGYSNRVAAGYSIILFLRKSKNIKESFCTVEIAPEDYHVIQCRAKGNGPAPNDALKWLEKSLLKIKNKISKGVVNVV